jgi:hypothetical protein
MMAQLKYSWDASEVESLVMLYLILKHVFLVESLNRDKDVIQVARLPFMWSVLDHTLETIACFHLMTRGSNVSFRTKPSVQINTEGVKQTHKMQKYSGQESTNSNQA